MRWRCWARDAEKPGPRPGRNGGQRKTMALPSVLVPVFLPVAGAAQTHTGQPAPVCRDARGAPRHQPHQGSRRQHGLAGAPEAAITIRRRSPLPRSAPESSAPVAWSAPTLPTPSAPCSSRSSRTRSSAASAPSRWKLTGDPAKPFELWPVDGATIRIDPRWDGRPDSDPLRAGDGAGGNRRSSFRCSTTSSSTSA